MMANDDEAVQTRQTVATLRTSNQRWGAASSMHRQARTEAVGCGCGEAGCGVCKTREQRG